MNAIRKISSQDNILEHDIKFLVEERVKKYLKN